MTATIRPAIPQDVPDITAMSRALAEFEHDPEPGTITELHISTALFGSFPNAHCHVADVGGQIAAMALWVVRYTVCDGAGLHVEQLFVRPLFRRRGLARTLLAALARECLENHYSRLAWTVLNWNSDAIALYDQIAGQVKPQRDSASYLLSGPRLAELAGPR